MSRKSEAIDLITKKLAGKTFLSYEEIASITGYHPKYIFAYWQLLVFYYRQLSFLIS